MKLKYNYSDIGFPLIVREHIFYFIPACLFPFGWLLVMSLLDVSASPFYYLNLYILILIVGCDKILPGVLVQSSR